MSRYICYNFFIKSKLTIANFEHRHRSKMSTITVDGKILWQDDSKHYDDPNLFPMTVVHKDHKLSFDKTEDGKLFMKVDGKHMIEYQFLNLMFRANDYDIKMFKTGLKMNGRQIMKMDDPASEWFEP